MGVQADADGGTQTGEQPSLPFSPSAALGRRLLEYLKVDAATHIDSLIEHLEDCSPSELIAGLFELEMQGLVRQLPGRNFVKVW